MAATEQLRPDRAEDGTASAVSEPGARWGTAPPATPDEERIPPGPLDIGDRYAIDVIAADLAGETTDRVTIDLPAGSGMVFAAWLERRLTETPELRAERHEADTLARLKAEAHAA